MKLDSIYKKIDKAVEKSKIADLERAILERRLNGVCIHPKIQEYTWEYDNGYGKQTKHTGSQCWYCGARDAYQNGRFSQSYLLDIE